MKINWKKIENLYVKAAKKFLKDFGKEHPHEYFYGFSIDGDAEYWYWMVSLNTEPLLLKQVEKSKLANGDLYDDQTIEEMLQDYRWNSGNWGYFEAFDPAVENRKSGKNPHYVKEYDLLMKTSQEYADSLEYEDPIREKIREQYLETMCRILIRLEDEDAFKPLNRSKHFRALCADHDETDEDSEERLDKIRRKMKREQKLSQSSRPTKTVTKKVKK
jgi:hypothetical protein